MKIQVLGTGCANCKTTFGLIEAALQRRGIAADVEKVEDVAKIAAFGVMSTPAIAIDGMVVHAGGVPGVDRIDAWLDRFGASKSCCGGCCGS